MDKELKAQLVKVEARLETLTIIISEHYLKNKPTQTFHNECLPGEHKYVEARNGVPVFTLFCEKCGKWKM
jgi:hypothetical protein